MFGLITVALVSAVEQKESCDTQVPIKLKNAELVTQRPDNSGMAKDYVDVRPDFPNSFTLMTWQMASRGLLTYGAPPEETSPHRPKSLPNYPDLEERWVQVVRVTKAETTIRRIRPDILLIQNIEASEGRMLDRELKPEGFELLHTTNCYKKNWDQMVNLVYTTTNSSMKHDFSFDVMADRKLTDPTSVSVFTDKYNINRVVVCNFRLRTFYKEAIQASIVEKTLMAIRRELSVRKVPSNFYLIFAGNFLSNSNSQQLRQVKSSGFIDAAFQIRNPKPITWTHPLKFPTRRSYVFFKDSIRVNDYKTLIPSNWASMSMLDLWRSVMRMGSNHAPVIVNMDLL